MLGTPELPFVTHAATEDDVPAIFALVNAAYEVETGDSGIAFKRATRFVQPPTTRH